MPGRKRARRLRATAGSWKGSTKSWAVLSGAALALASVSNCGFPEYDFHSQGGAGGATAGSAGAAGAGASGGSFAGAFAGSSADAGVTDAPGGGGSMAQGGGDAGADGGAAGAPCVYPAPLIYPDHCFDHAQGDGETGIDCGGGKCSACAGNQTCVSNDDCLSRKCSAGKTCLPVFSMQYTSIVDDAYVRSPKFKLVLMYQDTSPTTLDQIRIRYYFNHNGVTEPILGPNSQTSIDPGNAQLDLLPDKIHTQVYRTALGPAAPNNGRKTDSYVEISYTSPASLINGTKLEITQDFSASSSDAMFEQNSHYSFVNGTSANEAITIFKEGKRVWGIEPPWVEFPDCAYAGGVNVNGKALTVSGAPLEAGIEAQLTFNGGVDYANSAAKATPTTDTSTTQLLTTARTMSGTATGTWLVPNGDYYAFAWVTAAASSDNGVLTINENAADKFYGTQKDAAATWALLGPYAVTVSDEKLALAVADGFVHVAGLKLYRAE